MRGSSWNWHVLLNRYELLSNDINCKHHRSSLCELSMQFFCSCDFPWPLLNCEGQLSNLMLQFYFLSHFFILSTQFFIDLRIRWINEDELLASSSGHSQKLLNLTCILLGMNVSPFLLVIFLLLPSLFKPV